MWLANEPVVNVSAVLDNHGTPVDVTGSVSMRFRSGATASVTFAGDTPTLDSRLTLFTDRYTITTDCYGRRLEMTARDGTPFHPPVPFAEGRGTPHANFVEALLGREALVCGRAVRRVAVDVDGRDLPIGRGRASGRRGACVILAAGPKGRAANVG